MIMEKEGFKSMFQASQLILLRGVVILALITSFHASLPASYAGSVIDFSQDFDLSHKSDGDLIDNFRQHRAEFDQLLKMVTEDKALYRVDYNWTAPEHPEWVGISKARIDQYRDMMKKLSIWRGFSANRQRKYIEFITSAQGFVTHGSTKGYLYTEKPPSELDKDLDELIRQGKYYGHRHIEGKWYLFYQKS